MKKNKIFVACDSPNTSKIKKIINHTKSSKLKIGYKFGLEFLNSKKGRNFVLNLKNFITFGDYKFNDIPNTCAAAIKAVQDLKFNYLTIHISSGLEALKAAKKVSKKTKLVGVTILTSLDREDLNANMYKPGNISDLVIERADRAFQAGADGVIASPLESKRIRDLGSSSDKLIVTPGIRPKDSELGDQKRISTPGVAIKNGSNHIVVGRPVIRSSDPKAAAHNILTEINS